MGTLFRTREQIFLTRPEKEQRLIDFLTPYEPLLQDVKCLACWDRPLSSILVISILLVFLLCVPEHGCFFFIASSLILGKCLNLARNYKLWGLKVTVNTETLSNVATPTPTHLSASPSSSNSPPSSPSISTSVSVDVVALAKRLASMWLRLDSHCEQLLRLRWERRGSFCAIISSFAIIGVVIGDLILPFSFLTLFVVVALTLPAVFHHQLPKRLIRRFAPLLMQLDLSMDIKRRPLAGRTTRPMRGSRHLDIDPRLQDIDEVTDVALSGGAFSNFANDATINDDDDDMATDGEDNMDLADEEVDEPHYEPAPVLRDRSRRDQLIESHLQLGPEHSRLSNGADMIEKTQAIGNRFSAPPSLFTTSSDLQDLGLVPFDPVLDNQDWLDDHDKENRNKIRSRSSDFDHESRTGLTPDWSREASGDEDDDQSLMEFLPDGVANMPSIDRRSDPAILDNHLMPRQYVLPPGQQRQQRQFQEQLQQQLNSQLLTAGSTVLASLAGAQLQHNLTSLTDNFSHNYRQQSVSSHVQSELADALDEANGNRGRARFGSRSGSGQGSGPGSLGSGSSDDVSGFEIIDRPDDQAVLEAAMRDEGL